MCGTNCIMTSGPEKKISMHLKHNKLHSGLGIWEGIDFKKRRIYFWCSHNSVGVLFLLMLHFRPTGDISCLSNIHVHIQSVYMKLCLIRQYAHHAYSVCLLYANLVIIKISFNCCLWDLDTMLLNLINKPCHRHFVDFENMLSIDVSLYWHTLVRYRCILID